MIRAIAVLALMLMVTACVAAPVLRVVEDFEGEVPELTDDAEIIEVEGNRVMQWAPDREEPWFLNIAFSGVELDEWDRLELRYRIEGAEEVDWWGVKVVDFPLGDGFQVPYRVPKSEVALGEWATADFTLHPVPMKWGDSPNETAQTIILRASGVQGEAPVFLVDDIRVARDALHMSVEPGGVEPAADGWRRDFTLEVRSAAEQPMTISFEGADVPDGATMDLPDPVELPAGERREAIASMSIPGGLPPLTQIEATFAAMSDDDDRVEEALTVSVPLPELEHPVLLVTRDDLPRIRGLIETLDWAREAWEPILRSADRWAEREIEMPDRGGQWYHWYTCDECGGNLQTVSPTEHVCGACGAEYTGWPYDDVVIMRTHNNLSNATRDLGLAYAVTGDDRYAAKAREILLGYADVYLDYPLHNKQGEDGGGACHVGAQPLSEATWLIPIVQGFDCIYDLLSEDERAEIAEKVLLPAAELVRSYANSIHNIPCWENAAYGMVGITLGVSDLASDAINGEFGFRNQIEQGVDDDGVWYEGSWGYHYYTMSALEPLAVAAEHVGIDLYSDRYLSMFTAPVRMMGPTGTLPAFNDSGRTSAMGTGRAKLYENAASHWEADELAVVLAGAGRRSGYQALLFGPDELPAGATSLSSTIFPAAGVAMLRTKAADRPGDLVHGVPANCLALDYGPHGGGHGHPDKLAFEMHVMGRLFATDAGSVKYGNPAHRGWYKQTLSHNTVVVDGESQQPTEGDLLFHVFGDNVGLVGVESDAAYHGVTLRRVMALLPDGMLDITLALSDDEHQYDWAFHGRGDLKPSPEMTPLEGAPGEGMYEWAEDWRSAGERDEFTGDWAIEDGPVVRFAHAAAPAAELFAAIGRGNPGTARDPFIMSRVNAEGAAWATAMWWGSDDAPEITLLSATRDGEELSPSDAFGLEVTVGGRNLILVTAAEGGATFGEIDLEGAAALVELDGERPVRCLAAEAARVTVNGVEIAR
ncbi:MAG: heparinase II/III domain-containing protein [Armatimonadota bacterium]